MALKHILDADQLVSIGKAAEMLDVHIETLRRWEKSGKIVCRRTPGGQRRFRIEDLRTVVKESK